MALLSISPQALRAVLSRGRSIVVLFSVPATEAASWIAPTLLPAEQAENNKTVNILRNMAGNLRFLSVLTRESEFDILNVEFVYKDAYEFARRSYLYPDYCQLLTDEDERNIRESSPPGPARPAKCTLGLVSTLREPWEVDLTRGRLSQIAFMREEVVGLHKTINRGEIGTGVVHVLEILCK